MGKHETIRATIVDEDGTSTELDFPAEYVEGSKETYGCPYWEVLSPSRHKIMGYILDEGGGYAYYRYSGGPPPPLTERQRELYEKHCETCGENNLEVWLLDPRELADLARQLGARYTTFVQTPEMGDFHPSIGDPEYALRMWGDDE